MKNKINQKTTSIIAITFLAAICLVSIPSDVYGFTSTIIPDNIGMHPGETYEGEWTFFTSGDAGMVSYRTFGNGTEFLSFFDPIVILANGTTNTLEYDESTVLLWRDQGGENIFNMTGNGIVTIPFSITIPEDYGGPQHYNADTHYYNPTLAASLLTLKPDQTVGTPAFTENALEISISPLYCGQHETLYDNIIVGTNSSDYILGTSGNDLIFGEGGNDLIDGKRGADCIYAGDGNDYIQTGMGRDTVYGGNGDDTIRTSAGNNTVYGEDGNDILYVAHKKGSNVLDGGNGTDVCALKFENTTVSITNCEVTE